MLREIRQQPLALERTFKSGLRESAKLAATVARRPPAFVVLVARGSSDNAAQAGRYLIETTTGIPVSLAAPSVTTLYKRRLHWKNALVVGISQSGESTDVNMVVEEARRDGALTVGITNESQSKLAGLADHTFLVRAGKEHSVAATKTYTGQIMALYLLTQALGGQVGDVARVPEWAAAALTLEDRVAQRASGYRFLEHAVAVGRGLNYASAQEFALKLMETCYVVAERFSGADFLHGPIAMLEHAFPVFLFTPSGVTWPGMRALWKTVAELGS